MQSVGRFSLIRSLGSGAMGEVFLARDPASGGPVVLKRLRSAVPPEILRRFEREYQVLAGLDHPNIVPVLEYGTEGGDPYYTMVHVEGAEPLDRWLARHFTLKGELPGREWVLGLFAGLTAGLDHLHSRGVLHRDIKPSNILVKAPSHAFLIDFGLAGLVQSELTRTGTILGTMGHLSPEQALGRECVKESDIFQMGLVLYRVLAGCDAVQDPAAYVAGLRHGKVEIPPVRQREPRIGEALAAMIDGSLALEPSGRAGSGAGFQRALGEVPPEAWQVALPGSRARSAGFRPVLVGALLAGLLAAVVSRRAPVGPPEVVLGFEAAQILVEPSAGEVEVLVTSSTSMEPPRRFVDAGGGNRVRLEGLEAGVVQSYRVRVAGCEEPVFEGQLATAGAPPIESIRREPSRIALDLGGVAAVSMLVTPGEGAPVRVGSTEVKARHVIEVPPLQGPIELRVTLVSRLGERVDLPARVINP